MDRTQQAMEAIFEKYVLQNKWIKKKPHPKQVEFLLSFEKEALFGGAASGGKSEALLMAAAMFVDIPGYAALLIRKTFPDLNQPNALIPRSKEWWGGTAAKWNAVDHQWTFPSGATITFGYLDHDDDLNKYQGAEFSFIGVDEATQHPENRYTYLFSRLRRPKVKGQLLANVPLRMRAASNPGGKGHEWVKRRFILPGPNKRKFIPSRVEDNPSIDEREYRANLAMLDPITRAQLEAGDWDVYEAGRFRKEWFKEFVVDNDRSGVPRYYLGPSDGEGIPVYQCVNFVIVDPAATEDDAETNCPTAIGVFALTPSKDILVLRMFQLWIAVDQIVKEIANICRGYRPMWVGIEDTGAFSSISTACKRHKDIPAVRQLRHEGKSKLMRATPAIIKSEGGMVWIPQRSPNHPWIDKFLGELATFTGDPDKDGLVDQVDVLSYSVLSIDRLGLNTGPTLITQLTEEEYDDMEEEGATGGGLFGWQR